MRFVALFLDDLDPRQIDADLTRRHFDYLRHHADRITDAGGLKSDPAGAFCGSLWVLDAPALDAAIALVDGDPYCLEGLRPDRRVFFWNRAPIPG